MMISVAFFPKMHRLIGAAEEYKEKVESVLYTFGQAEMTYVSDDQLRQFFTAIDIFTSGSACRLRVGASESDHEVSEGCTRKKF